jgi:hypothetical protein
MVRNNRAYRRGNSERRGDSQRGRLARGTSGASRGAAVSLVRVYDRIKKILTCPHCAWELSEKECPSWYVARMAFLSHVQKVHSDHGFFVEIESSGSVQ